MLLKLNAASIPSKRASDPSGAPLTSNGFMNWWSSILLNFVWYEWTLSHQKVDFHWLVLYWILINIANSPMEHIRRRMKTLKHIIDMMIILFHIYSYDPLVTFKGTINNPSNCNISIFRYPTQIIKLDSCQQLMSRPWQSFTLDYINDIDEYGI